MGNLQTSYNGGLSMWGVFRKVPRKLRSIIRFGRHSPLLKFTNSKAYWDERYQLGRNSGSGSYGHLAAFKAEVLNSFIVDNHIRNVIEFGCGDGNQLNLAKYKSYVGVDVSETAIQMCKQKFKGDSTKQFIHLDELHTVLVSGAEFDLSLSLDVIYHLIEDDVFFAHMNDLFSASSRFVIIYSSNADSVPFRSAHHVRHRKFSEWIDTEKPSYKCIQHIRNRYPYTPGAVEGEGSFADFYMYEKQ